MTSNVWAAVPVKEFADAKERLSTLLTPVQRKVLAAAMLEDVLAVLTAARLAGVMLNTLDPTARALAQRYGARIVTAEARSGHSGAVAAMATILAAEGAGGMLTCPGDIPAVSVGDIAALLEAHGAAPAVSIVPAHDERGSNAVLLTPPDAMALRFGDDSFLPHLDAARRQGLEPRIVRLAGIALDIDNPADARAFLAAPQARGTRARALLAEFMTLRR
ncbi:MAG: 2-phospho-L-lactate guanylyltransferase [Acetobacteraceae bacterium]